ncbi:MAG TPA: hypothetical protein PLC86_21020, partial [Candidatus Accumulibacter phosphatis]|nr:hypothetical protein [Candidatus Accumulibacter phosphatis]
YRQFLHSTSRPGRDPEVCIYGGDDQDLACLRQLFPHLPLIGAYGTGQMAPMPRGGNRLLQNAVVSALISQPGRRPDVQPDA